MASSSLGWRELPYARLPLNLDGSGLAPDSFELRVDAGSRARIHLISGVRAEADMMRGEETEILGIFADGRHPQIAEDGLVVLPGTHSKHVRLRHRQLTGFRTYMTGELFDVLSAHSLLRASVQKADGVSSATLSETASRDAFAAGVREASVCGLAGSLFQTRVRTVLQSVPPVVNRWFLSGLLVGSEVADLAAREWDVPVALAAAEPLHAAYGLAFEILGLKKKLTVVPPEEMALASVRGHRLLLAAWAKADLQPVH
jgi:2-dehydro-3-deoxygalactonokinase